MEKTTSYYFYRRAASPVHIGKLIPSLELGETKLREISKNIGMTYSNLSQAMQDAHKEGIIVRKKINNTWEFELTAKGRALCDLCKGIAEVIERWDSTETPKVLNKLNFGLVSKDKKTKSTEFNDSVIKVAEK